MSATTETEVAAVVPEVPKDLQVQLSAGLQATKTYPFSTGMSEEDFKARVAKIVWIKDHLMQEGTHYGTTPGCNKPSLYQPGAQMLNIIFQHAPSYQRESERLEKNEHSRRDFLCNVNCTLTHYPTGLVVGAGVGGSCTAEARWAKKPVFDVYNSTLKIAAKRAYVAATVSCVGVSEIWTQDTEDNPELYRDEEPQQQPARRPQSQPPRPQPTNGNGNGHQRTGGKLERVEGFVSRVWENDYQDKHYFFAKLDKGQQLQATDAELGKRLMQFQTGQAITVMGEPSPKPGKWYLKSIDSGPADDYEATP
jgi:hypothetical protein